MTIKQVINTTNHIPPHTFDVENAKIFSSIIVYEEDGKYGIATDKGFTILPTEYDNIFVFGFGLLKLLKNGKQGFLHIKKDRSNCAGEFEVLKLVPCEYDTISSPYHEEIVIMEKYTNYGEIDVDIYFTRTHEVCGTYNNYNLLNRDIIEVTANKKRLFFDTRNGQIFFSTSKEGFAHIAFEATTREIDEDGTSHRDYTIIDTVFNDYNNAHRFIYYNGKESRKINFDDFPYVFFSLNCFEGHSPIAEKFIINRKGKICVLDSYCNEITSIAGTNVKIKTNLTLENDKGLATEIPCQTKVKKSANKIYLKSLCGTMHKKSFKT